MKYLLDTNVVIRWLNDEPLKKKTIEIIDNTENKLLVSGISYFEIEMKRSLKKLELPRDYISILKEDDFEDIPFDKKHALKILNMPWHHSDPFDRMIIAQAHVEEAILLTTDRALSLYDVAVMKA